MKTLDIKSHEIIGMTLLALVACGGVDPSAEPSDSLEVAHSYVIAIEDGDVRDVERLLSTELLERIRTRGTAASDDANLRLYVESERSKLLATLDESTGPLELVRLSEVGDVAAISLRLDQTEMLKPLYLVDEGSGWRVNVTPPTKGEIAFSTSGYQVKNDDLVNRKFSCSGSTVKTVAPNGQLQVSCKDTCSTFWDGTRFTAGGGSVTCDYNTWGIDMYIRGGHPVCHDPC